MLSLIGYGLLGIVAAIGVVALLVLILPTDHLAVAPRDVVPSGLPARPEINAADVTRVRLPVTLRGYRMVDTDAVLDRLAIELLRREEEIDELRRAAGLGPRPTWTDGTDRTRTASTVPTRCSRRRRPISGSNTRRSVRRPRLRTQWVTRAPTRSRRPRPAASLDPRATTTRPTDSSETGHRGADRT